MRTFIENYLHFMKNCIRPHYEKLKPLKSGFIENSKFENNRDPCKAVDIWVCNLGQPANFNVDRENHDLFPPLFTEDLTTSL